MPRPWMGRKPRPWMGREPRPEVDSFKLPPPGKKGIKPVQSPGLFLVGLGPKYTAMPRGEVLWEELTAQEMKELVKGCLRARRQLNTGRDGLTHNMLEYTRSLEAEKSMFQQEGKLFESWYPDTFTKIFGHNNVGELHGFMYKYLKSLVLELFGPESIKERLLHDVEKSACFKLHSWSGESSIDLKESIAAMIFDLTAKKLINYDPSTSSENLRDNFVAFMVGLISFPLNIPGTAYNKCLQGRKKAMKVLKDMLAERRSTTNRQCNDFFDYVIEE